MAANNSTAPAPPKFDQYVVLDTALVVWAKKPPHEVNRPHTMQTVVVNKGQVIRHPEWIGEDDEESQATVERLLTLGVIARKADVDSGKVIVPADSMVDELNNLRPVEQRPPTVLQRINRMRELDGNPQPIESVMVGPEGKQRPLVMREVVPFTAPAGIVSELVPAAQRV